jgi:hypothetical protein
MATKTVTRADIKAGRIYRCSLCETKCNDEVKMEISAMVAGRANVRSTHYFCEDSCADKYARDFHTEGYTTDVVDLTKDLTFLKQIMGGIIGAGRTSKTCFEAIKMTRLQLKCKIMLLGRETPRHIVEVELFKLSQSAMQYAELVAEDEDPVFNGIMQGAQKDEYTQIEAYNLAMWAREQYEDKRCLSMWFD